MAQGTTIIDVALVALTLVTLAAIAVAAAWRWLRQRPAQSLAVGTGATLPLSPAQEQQIRERIALLEGRAGDVTVPAAQDVSFLPASRWLTIVNDRPHQVPHLAVYGPSGVGKTTLVQGIVAQRTGKLFILIPNPRRQPRSSGVGCRI